VSLWNESYVTQEQKNQYEQLLGTLYALEEDMAGGAPATVELSPEAKRRWAPFHDDQKQKADREPEGPARAARFKGITHAARLALIFHECRVADGDRQQGPIDGPTMDDALTVAQWCTRETIRVYRSLDIGTAAMEPKDRFLARLPQSFTTNDARAAFPSEKDERTMYRWLNDLCEAGKLVKEVKGKYRKTA